MIRIIRQSLRSFWRYKGFTAINLLGLSMGIAAVTLIFLISGYERLFDRWHSKGEEVFRIVGKGVETGKETFEANVPFPTARFLRAELPGITATQIHYEQDLEFKVTGKTPVTEKHIVFADSAFFRVLDFSALPDLVRSGNIEAALSQPNKAILTESMARKHFGSANPIGQTFQLQNQAAFEVMAVIRDLPATSHLPVHILVSLSSLTKEFVGGIEPNTFSMVSNGFCYVRVRPEGSGQVNAALRRIVEKNAKEESDKNKSLYVQPLHEVHFDPTFDNGNPTYTVSPRFLRLLLILGGFILLIACVNYINLSTSLAFTRSREVGVRKTIGASRAQLFTQYLSETFLLTSFGLIIGLALSLLFLPLINGMLGKSIEPRQLLDPTFIGFAAALLVGISLLSGIYPALVLSGFRPIESLKNQLALPGRFSTMLRKGLVVFQFTTSIGLIICTLVIARQMHYFSNKSLGFNKQAVVEVGLPLNDSARIEAFRARLTNQSGIREMSFCLGAPVSTNGISTSFSAPELPADGSYNVKVIACDRNYVSTYGLQLLAGRWYTAGEEKSRGAALVVNEEMMRTLGYQRPEQMLGRRIRIGINKMEPQVIGVVKDFHTSSLHQAIGPVALLPFPYFYHAAGVRLEPGDLKPALAKVESAWRSVYPEYVYDMKFIDETLQQLYEEEGRNYKLFQAFSIVSVFICCIGLWGLLAFVVVRRTKEIGIRKVLGASVAGIMGLLSKEFVRLVLIALVVASPIAGYLMHEWLQGYAYRVPLSWWIFGLAGVAAVLIALITISFQALRAALANPVKSLRSE